VLALELGGVALARRPAGWVAGGAVVTEVAGTASAGVAADGDALVELGVAVGDCDGIGVASAIGAGVGSAPRRIRT
jgi:hypothetical protein